MDHQVPLESPVRTRRMVNQAKMETKADLVKMPEKKKNSCPFHPNANAKPSLAQLVPLDPKAPMEHLAKLARLAAMVNQVLKVHLAHQAHLVPMVSLVLLVHLARLAS